MATTFVRKNAWSDDGSFQDASGNPTQLYWYAIGVRAMQARELSDPASWWYFGAIHGQLVLPPAPTSYPGWAYVPAPPSVPTSPFPPQSQPAPFSSDQYWDQCQHGSWFFPPWHRGYLAAIEKQLRADIVAAGGPTDWALPYWNYFGPDTEYNMPTAFGSTTMPDGSANPLFVTARYGPDGDGSIYVPTPAAIAAHPGDPNYTRGPVTDVCLGVPDYDTGGTTGKGFGGHGPALFTHDGDFTGDLEANPHNSVHVYVGGKNASGDPGMMGVVELAGLDPIFYMHHANIDRMWAVWNTSGKTNPEAPWSAGPSRGFIMPVPGSGGTTAWPYTPGDVTALGMPDTDYTYDDLVAPTVTVSSSDMMADRISRLRGTMAETSKEVPAVLPGNDVELVGASSDPLKVRGARSRVRVDFDGSARSKVAASLAAASTSAPPDRVYLSLENIRGTKGASVLSVYVNLPEGAQPNDHPELFAGSVALFSSFRASDPNSGHPGISCTFDITQIVDRLHLEGQLSDSIHVTVIPDRAHAGESNITVGRIDVHRKGR